MNQLPTAAGLIPAIQESLNALISQLLRKPLIARVALPLDDEQEPEEPSPGLFALFATAARPLRSSPKRPSAWRLDSDTATVRVDIDYDDRWRGYERDVRDTVDGCVESCVLLLTDAQRQLLERSPEEFQQLQPGPRSVELLAYRIERIGGQERVVELTVAEAPEPFEQIRHLAIVANLIPLRRQLEALRVAERALPGDVLGPLRVLLGLDPADLLPEGTLPSPISLLPGERLDAFQAECIAKALSTPHFALIQGPPGSGKTTVIGGIIRRAVDAGLRVLVVSPTHVAVDNVVEKLVPGPEAAADRLPAHSLPLRFSSRKTKLSPLALQYWVSSKKQHRAATLSLRLERLQRERSPLARQLYARVDDSQTGEAPLSKALAATASVLCGTPIGLLSCAELKLAQPGEFDLLIVDEVSKLTLPDFLAIAVMARRWVLVGDPAQLPPFNNAAESGCTLDPLLDSRLELACSLAGLLDSVPPRARGSLRIAVVARDRARTLPVIEAQLHGLDPCGAQVVVCEPKALDSAIASLAEGSVQILVERGLTVPRPAFASGARLVEARQRAGALLHEVSFQVFHDWPWAERAGIELSTRGRRKSLARVLPTAEALRQVDPEADHAEHLLLTAETYALNTVSVYDWLAGFPIDSFDVSPLTELAAVMAPLAGLRAAVTPYTGVLRKQYRMHSSLSRVPRELFYFGEALQDGKADAGKELRVRLLQVSSRAQGEQNPDEAEAIVNILRQVGQTRRGEGERPLVLVITPYREQERLLRAAVDRVRASLDSLEVEVCTMDRCQGREAAHVLISLTRNRASPFLDAPKRWNVALTRAQQGLFLVGDIEAFREEARRARGKGSPPRMSLLARIIESYDHQGGER